MSWSRRYTKSYFLAVPLISYLFLMFCFGMGIGSISEFARLDSDGEVQEFLVVLVTIVLFCIEYLITPLLALTFTYTAIRRNVQMLWPLIGILVLSFFGSGFETVLREPIAGTREGGISLIWGWSFLPWRVVQPGWSQTTEQLVRVLFTLGLAYLTFKNYRPYEIESN